jgi:mRNA interferase RelE/StbE
VTWTIKYSEPAAKQLKKLDKFISDRIDKYLNNKVAQQKNPRILGKALLHDKSGLWCYRMETYRIICEIVDKELIVLVLRVSHRKDIYDK